MENVLKNISESFDLKENSLSSLTLEELVGVVEKYGEKSFRAKQIYEGITLGKDLKELSNISSALKQKISADYSLQGAKIRNKFISKDGTVKYLFELFDGNIVEGVLMKYTYGNTICISTHVGCRMGCVFCASGINGLKRNMTAGEMLSEVLLVNEDVRADKQRAITNIVLMGTGEPLDNFENVVKFIRLVSDERGINISQRNISLSTSGLVNGIERLLDEKLKINLTISMHSLDDNRRKQIMPVANRYTVDELIKAAKKYFDETGRRVYFEYSMIENFNDRDEDIELIATKLKGFPLHLNLIRLNYVKEAGLKGTSKERINEFMKALDKHGISNTLRRNMGSDISGACGQLRRKYGGDQ